MTLFKLEHTQSVEVDKVKEHMNKEHPTHKFDNDEIYAAIDKMMEDNQLMLADNVVFLI